MVNQRKHIIFIHSHVPYFIMTIYMCYILYVEMILIITMVSQD